MSLSPHLGNHITYIHIVCKNVYTQIAIKLGLFSKEMENLAGDDSRNDDGSRGDLSTASDDVNVNNAAVSTSLGLFLASRGASFHFHPQETMLSMTLNLLSAVPYCMFPPPPACIQTQPPSLPSSYRLSHCCCHSLCGSWLKPQPWTLPSHITTLLIWLMCLHGSSFASRSGS